VRRRIARERAERRTSFVFFRAVWRILATPDSSELPIGRNVMLFCFADPKVATRNFVGIAHAQVHDRVPRRIREL
jgi:hypothetical protein